MGCAFNKDVKILFDDSDKFLAKEIGLDVSEKESGSNYFAFCFTGVCRPEDPENEQLHYVVLSQPPDGKDLEKALNQIEKCEVPVVLRDVATHFRAAANPDGPPLKLRGAVIRPRSCCACSINVAVLLVNAEKGSSKLLEGRRLVQAEPKGGARRGKCQELGQLKITAWECPSFPESLAGAS